jgi:hypothetical protein
MLKIEPLRQDFGFEPEPRFASDDEIALAEALRRQLEERYFGHPVAPEPLSIRPSKNH